MLEELLKRICANDPTLTQINLRGNNIGTQGVEALKQNQAVTQINLVHTAIGAQGARALAEMLKQNFI